MHLHIFCLGIKADILQDLLNHSMLREFDGSIFEMNEAFRGSHVTDFHQSLSLV